MSQTQPADWTEYNASDKEVIVMQVIKTTLLRRGNGKETPIRAVTQYWSMQGDLLAERDPLPQPEKQP